MIKDEKLYLIHIVEASQRIVEYSAAGIDEFLKNKMMQDAIIKVLANITESTSHLTDETRLQYEQIPWAMVKSFRNILVHDYLGDLDLEVVWKVIHESLPVLVDVAKKILKEKYNIQIQ